LIPSFDRIYVRQQLAFLSLLERVFDEIFQFGDEFVIVSIRNEGLIDANVNVNINVDSAVDAGVDQRQNNAVEHNQNVEFDDFIEQLLNEDTDFVGFY
jgi:hypothetical protein